ncbi:putative PurR-regulated permease PerM [Frondihabitans sp. PhB188]|uniref:AI-2E family transporter n=1 Tax=Frondihabitans sp. PhB188 TaxID=2485200 RepID=UPI000F46BD31|nr:AI-2E family transporter [Frondihabitans sp. PhB188]ROQ40713.1 putative PurR-regulated permease PerM [Frondihabitans sp. PhB188]
MSSPHTTPTSDATSPRKDPIPEGLKVGAGFTGRVIVITAGLALVGLLVYEFSEIVIPLLIGVILSALLLPLEAWLRRRGIPKWISIVVALLVVFGVIGGLGLLVTQQVISELPALEKQVTTSLKSAESLLATHPFGLTESKIDGYVADATTWLQSHASDIGAGAAAAGSSAIHLFEGVFIVFFVTLFALIDGRHIWEWVVRIFPKRASGRIHAAGDAGWRTLTSFIRVQLVVAATDAIGIGVGALILGVPLAVPIAVVVFFGAFVPVVGAIVGGIAAVGIALVFNGWVHALIMLGIVLLVQQLESHVLHPLLTGSAVKVHPLGIVLGVIAGSTIAGVAGAFFAVPFIATVNAMIVAAYHHDSEELTGAGHDPDPKAREVDEPGGAQVP